MPIASTMSEPQLTMDGEGRVPARVAVAVAFAGLVALGAALRFGTLGLQAYHHDEVITVMRVIPGSFWHMLQEVKASESNPPLYYVLAWGWSKVFGSGEVGVRSLSAVFGAATVALGYPIGRELGGRRAGLALMAMLAVNPMLIWYSQEARSYALLVFFCALSLLFFLRALERGETADYALWAVFSALALCSHYFAVFAVAIEAAWLLLARRRWRTLLPALAGIAAVGAALLPLLLAQINPAHIGWVDHTSLGSRIWATAVSFAIGETGHVIAEPPRNGYAILPLALVGAGALLLVLRGNPRERRRAALCALVGLGVVALATAAALAGHDYVVERNLLPALLPLAAVAALGYAAPRAGLIGLLALVGLCVYWLAFDIHVTQTPNLQRPDFREVTRDLGPASTRRAIVSWKLAADPVGWYLPDASVRMYSGVERVGEIDVVGKPRTAREPVTLPPAFHLVQRIHADRLTVSRYASRHLQKVKFHVLNAIPTGFGSVGVVLDGPKPPPRAEARADGGKIGVWRRRVAAA
jgi:4-amino-4-deoxy-L-arabinose transferase-like glycosyltransferase